MDKTAAGCISTSGRAPEATFFCTKKKIQPKEIEPEITSFVGFDDFSAANLQMRELAGQLVSDG